MKNIKYILVFVLFSLLTSISSNAQRKYQTKVFSTLQPETQELLKESNATIGEYKKQYVEAETLYAANNYKNAEKNFSKTAGKLASEYRTFYGIYRDNLLEIFQLEADSSKKYTIERLQYQAANYFRKSISYRKNANLSKEDSTKCRFFIQAHKSEESALNIQEKAYSVYYNWIDFRIAPEDNSPEYKVVDETEGFDESFYAVDSESDRYSDFVEQNPDNSANVYYANSGKTNDRGNNSNQNNYIVNKTVFYRVQIASSKKILATSSINRICPQQKNILSEIDNGRYKYVFGKFNSYPEALAARNSCGVKGAFIVVYKNGNRVKSKAEQKRIIPQEYQNYDVNYTANNQTGSAGVEFRVQIGVSRIPASDSQVKRMNTTKEAVKVYKSPNYYKYTVGSFTSYTEAMYFRNANGLQKSFIVKYKNGKEVSL